MTMLTSTSCATGGVLCTTLAHIHKPIYGVPLYMRTHNLPPVTAHLLSDIYCEVYAHIQVLLVNCERDMRPFHSSCTLQCTVVLARLLTTLSLEAFSVCIAMASLRVYCLLLLMHLLHALHDCEVLPIL